MVFFSWLCESQGNIKFYTFKIVYYFYNFITLLFSESSGTSSKTLEG